MKWQRPPAAIKLYFVGLIVVVGWGLLPSKVHTSYSWTGVLVALGLLIGLYARSALCRRLLVALGLTAALGTLLIQTQPLEFVATAWSCLMAAVTVLLITPSARSYTKSS